MEAPQVVAPSKFQLRAKNVSLTYPQCDLDKGYLLEQLHARFGDNLSGILVVTERHADGHPHLHAYLRFQSTLSTRDPRYFDVDGHHPNAQSCRSPRNWIRYCLKEDSQPATRGLNPEDYKSTGGERLSDTIAGLIDSGNSLGQIRHSYPGFLLLNMRKALDYQSFAARESLRRSKSDFSLVQLLPGQSPGNGQIVEWLNDNIRKPRPLRTKQLWLHGIPGSGKTSLVMALEEYLMVYWVPQDMDFLEHFDDDYDLIVFDEMKSQKKLTWLNQFIVGAPTIVNIKGASVIKKKNPPVLFLSNLHPEQAYTKWTPQRDAFIDRLQVVECNQVRIELKKLDLNE